MIYIENDVINLTRGDDASLVVPMKTSDGETYEMGQTDYLIFGLRELPDEGSELLLEITSEPGENTISISHDDTSALKPGFYSAEIQLMAGGEKRITVWPKLKGSMRTSKLNRKNFCLMTEVVEG